MATKLFCKIQLNCRENPQFIAAMPTSKKNFLLECVDQMLWKNEIITERMPGILQQTVSSTKTRQKMETSNRFKCLKQPSVGPNIQNGDGRSDMKLHLKRGMGSFCRSGGRVLSHPHSSMVTKSSTISCGRLFVSIQSPTFWYSNCSTRIQLRCQISNAYASKQRHSHTPVSR